jgi:hypothetical protein
MKTIPLPQNRVALVDDDDYERVSQYRWNVNSSGYAQRDFGQRRGIRKIVSMHQFILNTPKGFEADHRNLNKLDNRRKNLRVVTRNQNQWNRPVQKNSRLGVKGVQRRGNRYIARIQVFHVKRVIGSFATIEEAARAYREAALQLHGEFARV